MEVTSTGSTKDRARAISFNYNYGINIKELERCLNVTSKPAPRDGYQYCPATFDGWLCWDYTRARTTAKAHCPYDFKPGFSPYEFAVKTCSENGTWFEHPASNKVWTDYTKCSSNQDQMILYMSISGYTISSVLLVISIAIFNAFRQLRCTRVILHQHLFVSFVLTGIMWVVTYSQYLANPDIRNDNPVWCKVIHIVTQYASVSNYFWMLCEGFFLHTIVVHAFTKQTTLLFICCVFGWGLPILPVVAYVTTRALDTVNDVMCWFFHTWTIWILSTPVVLSLVVNFILLLNILRILLSKIRAFNTAEHNQNRRAVKATMILIPLLGLQNLLTLVKPPMDDPFAWHMTSAVLVSYQGAAVSLIYCFFNGEVLTVLKRKRDQWRRNYDPTFLGRPSSNSTTVMALDESTCQAMVIKNGVTQIACKNNQDTMELQLMVSSKKSDKEVTFTA